MQGLWRVPTGALEDGPYVWKGTNHKAIWLTAGLPSSPAGEIEGGYAAYAAEIGSVSDRIHVNMGVAAIVYSVLMGAFLGLRGKILDNGKSTFAFLAGILIIIGFAGTIA